MKYRAYPIRYNKECYQIQIHCYHICSNLGYACNHTDQPCEYNNSIIPTYVNLSSFNYIYPDGHCGSLYNPDNIVIKDTDFTIYINFPLNKPVAVPITTTQPVTTRVLLSILQSVYSTLYDEEMKTASMITKRVIDPCFCINQPLQEFIPTENEEKGDNDECCICYCPMLRRATLGCQHSFHKACLVKWITTGNGDSCPLCRTSLRSCQACRNTRFIERMWQGKVIPLIYRETMERNETDGLYNIHTYDLQQLSVEQCIYNPRSRTLQVKINV